MGIAAYNRGSKAIGNHIFPPIARVKAIPKSVETNLPEGVLRSTFLPDDERNIRVWLSYEHGWYVIHTRFQNHKRVRSYEKAVKLFEKVEMWGLESIKI